MKIQKLLIQIESGADTRWLVSPDKLAQWICAEVDSLVETYTEGTAPAVTVIREERTVLGNELPTHPDNCPCQMCRK